MYNYDISLPESFVCVYYRTCMTFHAHCKKRLVVLSEWLPWLQTIWWGNNGYMILVLLHKQPEPQSYLIQLTTLQHLWGRHYSWTPDFKIWCFFFFVVTLWQMFTFLQDHGSYCMLFDTCRCKDIQWLLYHGCGKLPPWFCYAITYTVHTLFVTSLCLWWTSSYPKPFVGQEHLFIASFPGQSQKSLPGSDVCDWQLPQTSCALPSDFHHLISTGEPLSLQLVCNQGNHSVD